MRPTSNQSGPPTPSLDTRLLRMIDYLHDTTRLEEGRQKLTPQPTNVHAAAFAVHP